ncbi:hypothetical protein HOY33_14910 [Brenneria sp. hezel4-2-4]|nr:hypothetical protein [Brenneria sp. hezel4-2-4]
MRPLYPGHEGNHGATLILPSTVLMIKGVFRLTLSAAQGFLNFILSLMSVPDYTRVSKRATSSKASALIESRSHIT